MPRMPRLLPRSTSPRCTEMGAPLAMAAAVPRSGARACNGGGTDRKPPKGPKGSKPAGRCRLTTADVAAAIAWRLDGISAVEIVTLTEALRPLAADFRESRPEVAQVLADLRRPGDRRDAWSLANAILARDARKLGDVEGFLLSGFAVIEAMRQGRRSDRSRSPLTTPMREFKRAHPDSSPDEAFGAFCTGECGAVADYRPDDDALQVAGWSLVTRETFVRQYRRL